MHNGTQGRTSPASTASDEGLHFARLSRQIVLHRQVTADSLKERFWWALVEWSVCGPDVTPDGLVLEKDPRGFSCKDRGGDVIPATQDAVREHLGLAPGMKSEISRVAQQLVAEGALRFGENLGNGLRGRGKKMYLQKVPAVPDNPPNSWSTPNNSEGWTFGSLTVLTTNLPTDTEARNTAVQWLNSLSTRFNRELSDLRTRYKDEAVQGFRERGIIIDKEKKSRRVEQQQQQPPEPEPEAPPAPAEQDVVVVADHLETDQEHATQFLMECRNLAPSFTVPEVISAIDRMRSTFGSNIRNPTILLLRKIPPLLAMMHANRIAAAANTPTTYSLEDEIAEYRAKWATLNPEDQAWLREKRPELVPKGSNAGPGEH